MPRQRKSLEEKMHDLDPYFVEEVANMDFTGMTAKIADLAKNRESIEEAKDDDVELQSLKEKLKVANQTYSEPLKAIKLKIRYLVKRMSDTTPTEGESTGS